MSQKRVFKKVPLADLVEDPEYQFFANWPGEKQEVVADQIKNEKDVRVPVVIDENNRILDGHQRVKAARAVQLHSITCERVTGLDLAGKLGYCVGQAGRRQLTREEVSQAVEKAVLRLHEYSDARISRIIGIASDKTIRGVRVKLVGLGQIPDHLELIGLTGVKQKATKAKKDPKPDESNKPGEVAGTTAGTPPVAATPPGEADSTKPDADKAEVTQQAKAEQGDGTVQGQEGEKGAGPGDIVPTKPTILLSTPGIILPPGPFGVPHTGPGILLPASSAGVPPIGSGVLLTPQQPKPTGRKLATTITRSPLAFRREPGRLVLEGKELDKLPPDLKEVLCLVAHEADATQVNVTLGTTLATLVIHCPDQK